MTNISEVAFDESAGGLDIVFVDELDGFTHLEPTVIEFRDYGVVFEAIAGASTIRRLVPWSFIAQIKQTA